MAAAPQAASHASGFVATRAGRLHYLDYGTAGKPAMLCLHGGAAHGHWFDFIAGGLTPGYHVRALDQRGHGDSAWVTPPAYTYEDYAGDLAEADEGEVALVAGDLVDRLGDAVLELTARRRRRAESV